MNSERIAKAIKAAFYEGAKAVEPDSGQHIADREWRHSSARDDYDDVLAERDPVVLNRVV